MLEGKKSSGKRMLVPFAGLVFATVMRCGITAQAAEMPQSAFDDLIIQHQSVSDNALADSLAADNDLSVSPVPDDSAVPVPSGGEQEDMPSAENAPAEANGAEGQEIQAGGDAEGEVPAADAPGEAGTAEENTVADGGIMSDIAAKVQEAAAGLVQETDSSQLQTLNYKEGILTDWQQINEALFSLSADSLTDPDAEGKTLVLQLQNVSEIPACIRDGLVSDDSGYTKYLHCNVGCGVSLVFGGNTDNSGFRGISSALVTVDSEKRGKKSMAVTVKFASHEDMGTVASLHVNLPQCSKGTKVSVYAETVSLDEDGNVTVGENACIGNTKADENGNVEVLIQSTANYMFVYKEAKD